jgi:PAS domain S-box-containing protein
MTAFCTNIFFLTPEHILLHSNKLILSQRRVLGMKSSIENIFELIRDNSDPAVIFDVNELKIRNQNKSADTYLHNGTEKDMLKIFSPELLNAIKSRKTSINKICILKEIDSEGDALISYFDNAGILHLKPVKNINHIQFREELLLSESRFRMLFEQSPLVIQIFSAEGDMIRYNNSFKDTWHIVKDQIDDYNLFRDKRLNESDFRIYLESAMQGEFSEILPIQYFPSFAESPIWMRGFIYAVRSNANSIREIVLILENITDQKKIEESFGIEASYRNAIESSISAGIAVVDLYGKQTYVNEAFCRLLGWSKEELTGIYPPFIYWAPENLAEIEACFNETISGNPSATGYELKFRKKDNSVVDVLVIINPLKEIDGSTKGWLASVSDISKLKVVEKEIKESLKEKEVLLKEIHHRVKNNLQIISSLLNLQLNYIKDKEMQMIFKESQNRVMSMALIHHKLYHSKNQLHINLQEYINELIQHLVKSYSNGKDINVDVKVNNVSLDNDRVVLLGLIINELISNSLQYGFAGRNAGTIKVHMNNGKSGISLVVKDDGKGFPDGMNFKKTNSLGLQLVNTLVSQLNGDITLRQSKGTEFDILFKSRPRYS